MSTPCVHSCKGLCRALTSAEENLRHGVEEYRQYMQGCTYPDVSVMLSALITEHEKMLALVEEGKEMLEAKFSILDEIRESFE